MPLPIKESVIPQVQNLELEEILPDTIDKLDVLKTVEEQPKFAAHKSENISELISFTKVESHKRHDKVIFNVPIKLEEPSVEITEIHSDEETDIPTQGEISYHISFNNQYNTKTVPERNLFDFCFSINKNT